MLVQTVLIITTLKLFFIPLYRSTDFEVHRNWLAVTYNLPKNDWYYENTSASTLDYPPFFAWLEYCLAHVAKFFDADMLRIKNLNYDSDMTVLFQRLSVIILDIIYFVGVKRSSDLVREGKLLVFLLLLTNPGLLVTDHIHFQYNGFLYGILLMSISSMIWQQYLLSAFWYAVLLNFKHIYLYVAPVYFVYLLRVYCFPEQTSQGVIVNLQPFSFKNFVKLGLTVVSVFALSFGPFINHLPQIFSRLFPFKRGLCHAYWAPNFWALYNIGDKILEQSFTMVGVSLNRTEAAMTGGLVQEYTHTVLPSVLPSVTFALSFVTMLPALVHMWKLCMDRKYRAVNFVRCLVLAATCSFLFGWHVHEKAILLIIIPLSFLSVLGFEDGKLFMLLSIVGHYSLFPLLYPKNLLPIKICMLLTHAAIGFRNLPTLYDTPRVKGRKKNPFRLPMLDMKETLYVYGFIFLGLYEHALHSIWELDKRLPFLPLLMTSVYCSVGVIYFWISYYHYFLTFPLSLNIDESKKKI